jgi:hypothetical protein
LGVKKEFGFEMGRAEILLATKVAITNFSSVPN